MIARLSLLLLFSCLRGVSFRNRGGAWLKYPSTQIARLVDALEVGLSLLFLSWYFTNNVDWINSLIVVGLSFISLIFGWWSAIDLGKNEGSTLGDFFRLTARGLLVTLPAGLWLMLAGLWLPVAQYPLMWLYGLSGALMGMSYGVATFAPFWPKNMELSPGPEQGELNFGLVMGFFFYVSMLYGQNL